MGGALHNEYHPAAIPDDTGRVRNTLPADGATVNIVSHLPDPLISKFEGESDRLSYMIIRTHDF